MTVKDPLAPTTTNNFPEFCAINNPTVANISLTASAGGTITWYDAPNNGNVVPTNTPLVDGTTYYAAETVGLCESDTRLEVKVTVKDPLAPTTTHTQQAFCAESLPTVADLDVTPQTSGVIKWYDSTTSTYPLNSNEALTSGSYYASETIGVCESKDRIQVIVTVTNLAAMTPEEGCEETDYVLRIRNTNQDTGITYQWLDASDNDLGVTTSSMTITTPGTYKVKVSKNTCFDEYTFDVDFTYCEIPKGISPNGDGLNDTFDLSNLKVKKLEIFNRYGMEMYSKMNYKNEWDGYSDSGLNLPDGTYYYVIQFESGKTKSGWVYKNSER